MSKRVLVVTTHHVKEVEERIDNTYDARRNPNETPFSRQDLLAASDGADALFITPVDILDSEFFRIVSPSVKVIATFSVGFEHIDLAAASRRKIAIAYTPGANSEATADIAMLLMLGASRRAYEAQGILHTGAWKPWNPNAFLGWQVGGKILGIFGMGRVGQAVAKRARSFGMEIHYSNSSQLPNETAGDAVFHKNSRDLLRESQFLSLHAPETPETHHFLNAETIKLLPKGSSLSTRLEGDWLWTRM